jgi:transposase-like protein
LQSFRPDPIVLWKKAKEERNNPDETGKTPADLRDELNQLKKENRRLKMEREILNKNQTFTFNDSFNDFNITSFEVALLRLQPVIFSAPQSRIKSGMT